MGHTLVYPLRFDYGNDPLRYSLRSAVTNLDGGVDRVIVVGFKPPWLTNVDHIPGNVFDKDKPRNVFDNIRRAVEHPDVPEQFTLMNDDFFLLTPFTPVPMHRGTLAEHVNDLPENKQRSWWGRSITATREWLEQAGITDPLSYEVHTPLPIRKDLAAEVLGKAQYADHAVQARSIYANYAKVGGERILDFKVFRRAFSYGDWTKRPILSTNLPSWKTACGDFIQARFTEPTRFEGDR